MTPATSTIENAQNAQKFEKISTEAVKRGDRRLTPGCIIVFHGDKKAKIKALTWYTHKISGCMKYYHPMNEKDQYIKVYNNEIVNCDNLVITGIDHFLMPKGV